MGMAVDETKEFERRGGERVQSLFSPLTNPHLSLLLFSMIQIDSPRLRSIPFSKFLSPFFIVLAVSEVAMDCG
jgi:hypothetical protein